jgi:protein-disulfide isomerase/uncharacterized membrane protein
MKKHLTLNGMTPMHALAILVSLTIIGVSLYLTKHYYDVLFPTGLGATSALCDISSFWNCDSATHSNISSILNVPIAFFGLIIGLLILGGSIFASESYEKTTKFVLLINFIGCLGLFLYSVFILGSLCPFCTVYYILSGIALFLFHKFSDAPYFKPELKPLAFWGGIVVISTLVINNIHGDKSSKQSKLNASVVDQYFKLKNAGDPLTESPFKIHMGTKNFADAPIRISVFSDFQCPFCKVVSDQLPALVRKYQDKINIQYFFYPLDNACNTNVKSSFHQYACQAAYLAACDKNKFHTVHDEIFHRQTELNFDNLTKWEKEFKLKDCFENNQIKEDIQMTIRAAEQYNLKSTPTVIVNGVKIEGSIPTNQYKAIFDEILKRQK